MFAGGRRRGKRGRERGKKKGRRGGRKGREGMVRSPAQGSAIGTVTPPITTPQAEVVCAEGWPAGQDGWAKGRWLRLGGAGPRSGSLRLQMVPGCQPCPRPPGSLSADFTPLALCRPGYGVPGGSGQTQLLPPCHSQRVSGVGQVAGRGCLPPPCLLLAAPGDSEGGPGGPGVAGRARGLPLRVRPSAGPAAVPAHGGLPPGHAVPPSGWVSALPHPSCPVPTSPFPLPLRDETLTLLPQGGHTVPPLRWEGTWPPYW